MGIWSTLRPTGPLDDAVLESYMPLGQIKAHLRIDSGGEEDGLLKGYRAAAVDHLAKIGISAVLREWQIACPGFPARIEVPIGPVTAIASITYLDASYEERVLDGSTYREALSLDPVTIMPLTAWPQTGRTDDAVIIRFMAGYAANEAPALSQALLLTIAHWFENRENTVVGMSAQALPFGVNALIAPFRRGFVA